MKAPRDPPKLLRDLMFGGGQMSIPVDGTTKSVQNHPNLLDARILGLAALQILFDYKVYQAVSEQPPESLHPLLAPLISYCFYAEILCWALFLLKSQWRRKALTAHFIINALPLAVFGPICLVPMLWILIPVLVFWKGPSMTLFLFEHLWLSKNASDRDNPSEQSR